MYRLTLAFAALLGGVLVSGNPLLAQDRLVVKGGRVIPISGPAIDGGVVILRGGKIEAVGKDLPIPADARVIDAAGKVVMPGFIEAHSFRGMDQANERNPNVPFLSVVDAIDPSQDYFEECLRNGVTTVSITPGNSTMFGGQAAVIKTAGAFVDQMLVKRTAGLKISLSPAEGRNRMGHLAALRKELNNAREFMAEEKKKEEEKKAAEKKPATSEKGAGEKSGSPASEDEQVRGPRRGAGGTPTPSQPSDATLVRDALVKLLRGETPAYIYCELAMDVPQAIKLTKEYDLKSILVLGKDCYKAVKQVAASKLPVILDPTLVFWETDPRTDEERQIVLPRIYREAGVPVTYQVTGAASGSLFRPSNLPPTLGTNYLWYQAATAVKYGIPVKDALEAVTLRPAEVLGVEKLVGSLEPGKDADVVILTGDPLKLNSWVQTTIVGGKIVYQRDEDRKLQQLLAPKVER